MAVSAKIIKGHLPSYLTGMYVRNAPSLHGLGNRTYDHMFDALSKLYAWTFNSSSVRISASFTPSLEWNGTIARGSPVPVRLLGGVTPPWTGEEWASSLLTFPDNAAINTWRFGSRDAPKLASTTDEMVLQGFALAPSAEYTGPLRFGTPTSGPLPMGIQSRQSASAVSAGAQLAVQKIGDPSHRARFLLELGAAARTLRDVKPLGDHSRQLAMAAASQIRSLPATSVLSTAHPHHDVADDSITYNVAGIVNPLAILDPD